MNHPKYGAYLLSHTTTASEAAKLLSHPTNATAMPYVK